MTDSVNFSWEYVALQLDPSSLPLIPHVYTGPGAPSWRPRVCVCSPPHLRRAAARPGLPAGIYWLALCPAAGRLVRSVLTTSATQRHLWTINSDTKAVGTTAEPTHAANWCFSMPPRRKKLLEDHRQWGFSMPCTAGVICRALPLQGGWKWERKYTNRQSSPTVKGRLKPGVVTTRYHWKTPVRGHVGSARELWRDSINNFNFFTCF